MFPVVNSRGMVIGTIPRNFIIILIRNFAFYNPSGGSVVEDIHNNEQNCNARDKKSITDVD